MWKPERLGGEPQVVGFAFGRERVGAELEGGVVGNGKIDFGSKQGMREGMQE
jgi:hypothetical protein